MENAKYEFLKKYLDTQKNLDFEDAWNTLSDFYQTLPERTKGKERKDQFSMLIEQMQLAFDSQLKLLAECPYVKIEIDDKITFTQLQQMMDYIDKNLLLLGGYVQADCNISAQKFNEIKTLLIRKGFKSNNSDELVRQFPIDTKKEN